MSTVPRSLADALRSAPDDALAALLRTRPDLLTPVPADLAQLAVRASSSASVGRALDRLDHWTLQVLEAACAPAEPFTRAALAGLLRGDGIGADDVGAAVERLLGIGLLWAAGPDLHVLSTVREMVGPAPAGLGPPLASALASLTDARLAGLRADLGLPADGDADAGLAAVEAHLSDPAQVRALLAGAPPGVADLLDQLVWGPPAGTVANADRSVRAATASSPVDWLLAHGMLAAADRSTVVLPREVALVLRDGRALADPAPQPPTVHVSVTRDPALVDRTAGQQAFTAVRAVTELLEAWAVEPPGVLRAGGLGVRDLRRLAALLDVEEWAAAVHAEVAHAAGLLGRGEDADPVWLPTPRYDLWRTRSTAEQWADLAAAWLDTTRVPGLVGSRDGRDKAVAALGPDLDRSLAPEVRRGTLAGLAGLPPGSVADAGAVVAVLAWQRPRRPSGLRADLVRWTLREADLLGITGLGALAAPGRGLLAADGTADAAAAVESLAPLLPQPLDHVLLQADLTAVAPGPLEADLAHALALMADVESRGGATVYRFSETSVRRALDAGRTASDLQALLVACSRTPVPQPLAYLVDDVARRHGRIRVGAASAYVRADDDAVLTELLAERRAAELRLRRLAPTVLAAAAPVDVVLDRLRAMGYAPAAETPDGDVLVRRPDSRRTPIRQAPLRLVGDPGPPGETLLAAAVRALRAGDRAARSPRGAAGPGGPAGPAGKAGETVRAALPRTATTDTLALLRSAIDDGRPVWIGYADTHGGVSGRVVDPVRLAGGYLTAYDHRYAEVHTFAVHRITGAAELDAEPA